jgi:hypothetical protein
VKFLINKQNNTPLKSELECVGKQIKQYLQQARLVRANKNFVCILNIELNPGDYLIIFNLKNILEKK